MADVKWIKLKVGMFDGESFKKIKRAKIGGESFRDKLTAVWFELMDLAGKCNHAGAFINSKGIPYTSIDDIATQIDRDNDELSLCMNFFINEGMVSLDEDIYSLANWNEYQNEAGLEAIREKKRIRQAKWREKKRLSCSNVDGVDGLQTSTQASTPCLPSIIDKELDIDIRDIESNKGGAETAPPRKPKEPAVISLILNDKSEYPITQKDINQWELLYPAVNVLQELRKMAGWLDANPTRRKTKAGIKRFVNNWLSREQDKGHPRGGTPATQRPPVDDLDFIPN